MAVIIAVIIIMFYEALRIMSNASFHVTALCSDMDKRTVNFLYIPSFVITASRDKDFSRKLNSPVVNT